MLTTNIRVYHPRPKPWMVDCSPILSFIVLECISAHDIMSNLYIYEGIYRFLLRHIFPSRQCFSGTSPFLFQQDNAKSHFQFFKRLNYSILSSLKSVFINS